MGKGDIKTKKGKRTRGSYGVTRKRKTKKVVAVPASKPKATKKVPKTTTKKTTETKVAVKKVTVKKATAKKATATKKKEAEK